MNNKLKEIFGPNFNLDDIDFVQPPNSLAILNSSALDSNKLFKALKSELELFYVERKRPIERQSLHKPKSIEWKEHFYHALQALLNEVMFTTSSRMKLQLLNKIYKWYYDKTGKSPYPEKIKYLADVVAYKDDLEIYIPQRIEPKLPEKKVEKRSAYKLSELKYSADNTESRSFFKDLLESEEAMAPMLPKVKAPRTHENFIRPYSPMKSVDETLSPIVKDFRSHSRAKSSWVSTGFSPGTLRYNSLNTRFVSDNSVNEEFAIVPNLRRIQIREVMKIKNKLASKRVICPVKVLEGGLVISDFTLDPIPPEHFPKGGELLMQDPRQKKKTSKKKRKKGKKK